MSSYSTIKPMRLLLMAIGSVGKDDAATTYCHHHFSRVDPNTTKDGNDKEIIVQGKATARGNAIAKEKVAVAENITVGKENPIAPEDPVRVEAFMSENFSEPPGAYTMVAEEFIREADAVLIVYSVTSRSAFKRVQQEYALIERVRGEIEPTRRFWHRHRVPPMPIILAGNIGESGESREVSTQEGINLGLELGIEFTEITVTDISPVEALFYDLVRSIQNHKIIAQLGNQSSSRSEPISASSLSTTLRSWVTSIMNTLRVAMRPQERRTPDKDYSLTEAISAYEVDIARRLILNGVGMNTPDSQGFFPLHLAAARGHLEIVRLLLEKGALVDQVAPLNGTALSIAAARGNNDIVKVLLEHGASLDTPCDYYGSVLQGVARRNHPSIKRHFELPSDRR